MRKKSEIKKYILSIDDEYVIDAGFVKGPVEPYEKCKNFFNLPICISNEFLLKYGNILNKRTYKLNFHSNNKIDREKIENILTDLYFDLCKTASLSNKYERINDFAIEQIKKINPLLIDIKLLRGNLICFDWNNIQQINALPIIIKNLVEYYYQYKELQRKEQRGRLLKVLDENRNNPYFNN